jgi:hypothetical protein
MPSKAVAFIDSHEAESKDIIQAIGNDIIGAAWKDIDGVTSITNRWVKAYDIQADTWVTYQPQTRPFTQGMYKHTDGKLYPVFKVKDMIAYRTPHDNAYVVDAQGYMNEVGDSTNTPLGTKIQVKEITYGGGTVLGVPGILLANVDDPTDLLVGKRCVVVEQKRKELDGITITSDVQWNEFQYVTDMPSDWNQILATVGLSIRGYYGNEVDAGFSGWVGALINIVVADLYTFTERYYTADLTNYTDGIFVMKCTPDVPVGTTPENYHVMFRHPNGQYNYFDVYYGKGFTGVDPAGDSTTTYNLACDLATVGRGLTPTIINQKEAEAAHLRSLSGTGGAYISPSHDWALDYDGVTKLRSPAAHFYYGADSEQAYLVNKKRRLDYLVEYSISVNNDRVCLVIEGDPSPDLDGYYRGLAYIGRINAFNSQDTSGNFAVTVGMGHLRASKTGVLLDDIRQDANAAYSGFGRYTSNGMYSVSMLKTRSNVLFQAYYPAFITQLPNYSGVGTIPAQLSNLELESDGFQPSSWINKYLASPIYLVHQYEGYRGYMEGIVAITDWNLVNKDELVVDTEEWKDAENHALGTYTETYKFFSLNSPVSFLKRSANPTKMTIAILKEVK